MPSLVERIGDFLDVFYSEEVKALSLNYPKERSLAFDYADLEKYDVDLADSLLSKPDEFLRSGNVALAERVVPVSGGIPKVFLRPIGLGDREIQIQDLTHSQINQLVCVKGVVTKRGQVLYRLKKGVFRCESEDPTHDVIKVFERDEVLPRTCPKCRAKLRLVEEESEFVDVQRAEIQELLERVKGTTPARIELLLQEDLVNSITPGDVVEVVGILRARESKRGIFGRFLEVVSIQALQKEFEEIEISPAEEEEIKKLASLPDVLDLIANAIAPGIYGHDEVKKALALQLFGGTRGKLMPEGSPIRSNVHILLIGDPGVAKTRFLLSVVDLAPKSVYVSGKSASGVGLTASAEKDELSEGGWTLKAGALVLASGGIAAIDEFDKIDEKEKAALHEAMESGTVSVAKAGIVARLKADTSVLAAANPKFGRFDPNRLIVDQFNIAPSLLSRFDLIFPIVDEGSEKADRALAEHLLRIHRGNASPAQIPRDLLRKYVAYARKHCFPRLSEAASRRIESYYLHLRKLGRKQGTIAITPRQMEGIIRLSEAAAKARLKEEVGEEEAEVAISLFDFMLKKVCSTEGGLDIDVITTGKPRSERQKISIVYDILAAHPDGIEVNILKEKATEFEITEKEVDKYLRELARAGEVFFPKSGVVRLVERV